MTKVFYNLSGKPIALYDGEYVFDTAGKATLFQYGDALYKIKNGDPVGIIAGGIIYNWDKIPQAWSEGCRLSLVPSCSDLRVGPPRVRMACKALTNFAAKEVPLFLLEKYSSNHPTAFRDGFFQ